MAFSERGGKVIAEQSLRADIPGATVLELDFSHQARINGANLAKGDAVTAEEDRGIMESYAAQLAPLLNGVPRAATANSPRVLTNSLDSGGVTYHFFVNDERTYGPRFGKWMLRFELGVPQARACQCGRTRGSGALRRTPPPCHRFRARGWAERFRSQAPPPLGEPLLRPSPRLSTALSSMHPAMLLRANLCL